MTGLTKTAEKSLIQDHYHQLEFLNTMNLKRLKPLSLIVSKPLII